MSSRIDIGASPTYGTPLHHGETVAAGLERTLHDGLATRERCAVRYDLRPSRAALTVPGEPDR